MGGGTIINGLLSSDQALQFRKAYEAASDEERARISTQILHARLQQEGTSEAFIEAIWKDEHGKRIRLHDVHKEWHRFIREYRERGFKRLGIIAPFKYGKTPNMLAYMLYRITQNRNLRGKIVSNDDDTAKRRVETLKQYIETDPDFKTLYSESIKPKKDTRWTSHDFNIIRESLSPESTLSSAGVLTTGIGGTIDLMLFDDPCDLNNSVLSNAKREAVKEAIQNVWLTRLDKGAEAIYIGTPWHAADATHMLFNRPGWVWLVQAISKDFSGIRQGIKINE